jgi:hypothetical protein
VRAYVVRVQEQRVEDETQPRLRGVVDEVATGRRRTFTSGPELLEALVRSSEPAAPDPDAFG